MQVTFESRDPDGAQQREHAVQRVNFVMRRLAWLVSRAKLQLSDINGPRGGVDKCCRLELKTDHFGTVTITSMARDWHGALESALSRAAQSLVRSWQRRRDRKGSSRLAFDLDQ